MIPKPRNPLSTHFVAALDAVARRHSAFCICRKGIGEPCAALNRTVWDCRMPVSPCHGGEHAPDGRSADYGVLFRRARFDGVGCGCRENVRFIGDCDAGRLSSTTSCSKALGVARATADRCACWVLTQFAFVRLTHPTPASVLRQRRVKHAIMRLSTHARRFGRASAHEKRSGGNRDHRLVAFPRASSGRVVRTVPSYETGCVSRPWLNVTREETTGIWRGGSAACSGTILQMGLGMGDSGETASSRELSAGRIPNPVMISAILNHPRAMSGRNLRA